MNATLQCLCNIPKFVNYFKYNRHLIEIVRNDLVSGNNTLSSSFKLLIEQLWPDKLYFTNNAYSQFANYGGIGSNNSYSNKRNESYAPKEFKEKISTMNELFKGVQANDAKDLVQFLIMTLHKELNRATNQNMNNKAINVQSFYSRLC
jgi:ubiquitin C-terminal hydrolase